MKYRTRLSQPAPGGVSGGTPYAGCRENLEDLATWSMGSLQTREARKQSLSSVYTNPDLGKRTVHKNGPTVRVRAIAWSSAVAARHNDDGSPTSFVSIEPGFDWLDLVVGNSAGTRTLTTGEGQHFHVFKEVPRAAHDR
jgi:hypothetical protein